MAFGSPPGPEFKIGGVKKKRQARRKKKQKRQHVIARERHTRTATPEPVDHRSISVEVTGIGGVPLSKPQTMVVIEPIRLPSGDDLYFQSPFLVPFYLLKSKTLRDRAEPNRVAATTKTKRENDGTLRPLNPAMAFDALEDLALSTILAVAAIESYVNDAIGRLPDDAMAEVPRRVGDEWMYVMRDKQAMLWFKLGEKIDRAMPVLTGRSSIKPTSAWQKYRKLARIRNGLLHPERKPLNDPTKPGPFGRLMLGQGSSAPEDAAFVIEALEPGWIPKEARSQLGF